MPDLAFSEMKFLSKSKATHDKSVTRQTERKSSRNVDKAQKKPADYGARFTKLAGTPRLRSGVIESSIKHSPPSPISAQPPNRYTIGHADDDHLLHDAAGPDSERKRKRTSSHNPYTWSESQSNGPIEIDEQCLKDLLSVKKMVEQEWSAASDSKSVQWDIEELKDLLEERKRIWDSPHRDITVCDDNPSCERGIKRRRLLDFDRQGDSRSCNQSNTKKVQAKSMTGEEPRNLKTVPIPGSPSALRSTYKKVDLNKQAHQKQLHGSPAQADTGFACSPRELRKETGIAHPSHCYPPPQQHDSVDADARAPVFESELRWIDAHCPDPLDRGPPGPEEDNELFVPYVDPAYDDIISLNMEFIDQHDDTVPDLFEEYEEEMLKQTRNAIATVPMHDKPWPSIEQPHQSRKGEKLHAEVEPCGFIGQRQYQFRGESPHFAHPPLRGDILQIQEMEEIRARNPHAGIPRGPSTAHASDALENEMDGFWREIKLY